MIVKTELLQNAVKKAIAFASQKSTIPIATYFLLNGKDGILSVCAYDFEQSCRFTLEYDGEDELFTAVPARLFHDDILCITEETVSLSISKNSKLVVKTKKHKALISTLDGNTFYFNDTEVDTSQIDGLFVEGVQLCLIAIDSKTEPRVFSGTRIIARDNKLYIYGTDTFRATRYVMDFNYQGDFDVVVPKKGIQAIAKSLSQDEGIGISADDRTFYASADSGYYTSQLLAGNYPSIEQFFTRCMDDYTEVKLSGKDLSYALKQMIVFAKDNSDTIYIIFENNKLFFRTMSVAYGETEVSVDAVADRDVKVALNSKYLRDFASLVRDVDTSIYIRRDTEPIYMKIGDSFDYMLMPVRFGQ